MSRSVSQQVAQCGDVVRGADAKGEPNCVLREIVRSVRVSGTVWRRLPAVSEGTERVAAEVSRPAAVVPESAAMPKSMTVPESMTVRESMEEGTSGPVITSGAFEELKRAKKTGFGSRLETCQ